MTERPPLPFISPMLASLARAIATAEGFWHPTSVPARAHNPGDLALGDRGHGTLGAEQITVFEDDEAGWNALYRQLDDIQQGRSRVYNVRMSIQEMAKHWTDTQQVEWAANVAAWYVRQGQLDVVPSTTLTRLLVTSKPIAPPAA